LARTAMASYLTINQDEVAAGSPVDEPDWKNSGIGPRFGQIM
jgi:hypothetical protein